MSGKNFINQTEFGSYLREEYKYRQHLILKLQSRLIYVIVIISTIPYAYPGHRTICRFV